MTPTYCSKCGRKLKATGMAPDYNIFTGEFLKERYGDIYTCPTLIFNHDRWITHTDRGVTTWRSLADHYELKEQVNA